MSNYWDFYLTETEGHPSSIVLDFGIRESIPIDKYSLLTRVIVNKKDFIGDEWLSKQEFHSIRKIEDSISKALCERDLAKKIARIKFQESVVFIFYARSSCSDEVNEAMCKFGDFTYRLLEERDSCWDYYKDVLYPSEEELQWIKDRNVVEELKKLGDDLSKKREIHHWIYFKSIDDKIKFQVEIKKDEYQVVQSDNLKRGFEKSYVLHIVRNDYVDLKSINKVSTSLLTKSKFYDGDYDGWDARVIKKTFASQAYDLIKNKITNS